MIKQFTLGVSRTVNLGNYESMRIEASVVMEMNTGSAATPDNPDYINLPSALDGAQRELRRLLDETWKAQIQPRDYYRNLTK